MTDKKIIILSPEDTIKYLAVQISDILHDSGSNNTKPYNYINIMVNWIVANNSNINTIDKNELYYKIYYTYKALTNNIPFLIGDDIQKKVFDFVDGSECKNCIVDSCGSNFCKENKNLVKITPSVLYDNGASEVLSTKKSRYKFSSNNYNTQSAKNKKYAYFNDKRTIKSYFCTTKAQVFSHTNEKNRDVFNNINMEYRDMGIIGYLMHENILKPVVIAFMGLNMDRNNGIISIQYSHYIDSGYRGFTRLTNTNPTIIYRGFSPSVSGLSTLHKALQAFTWSDKIKPMDNVIEFSCEIYTEFVAKHWGDLGLMFDVIKTDMSLITVDNHLLYLCVLFGVNHYDDKKWYGVSDTTRRPIVEYQQRTNSLFVTTPNMKTFPQY
jgi:hypothetical protein